MSNVTPSWAYCVDVYVTPKEFIPDGKNRYTIKFEEDNWVSAPNGGVATSSVFDYSALYLPQKAIKSMIDYEGSPFSEWDKFIESDKYAEQLQEEITKICFDPIEGHYLYMGENGFVYESLSKISTASTVGGFVCLIGPAVYSSNVWNIIGNIATTAGFTFTVFSPDNVKQEEFATITQKCIENSERYNINLSLHNYDIIDRTGERYDCQNWNYNGYINKYYYTGVNGNYRIIRINDFEAF